MEKNGNGHASTTALVYAKRGKHFISTWWNHVDSFQCCRILAGHNLVKEKNCVAKKCCMGSSKEVFRGNYFEGVKEIKIQILYSVHSADSHQKTDKVIELHSSQSLPQPSPTLFNLALKALNATWSEVKGRTKCYIQGWTEIKFWKWKKALYFLGPTWSRGWYHTLVRYLCSIPLSFPTIPRTMKLSSQVRGQVFQCRWTSILTSGSWPAPRWSEVTAECTVSIVR